MSRWKTRALTPAKVFVPPSRRVRLSISKARGSHVEDQCPIVRRLSTCRFECPMSKREQTKTKRKRTLVSWEDNLFPFEEAKQNDCLSKIIYTYSVKKKINTKKNKINKMKTRCRKFGRKVYDMSTDGQLFI